MCARQKRARRKAFERQRGKCFWCGLTMRHPRDSAAPARFPILTADHLIPVSRGGTDAQANIVAACHNCNRKRGNAHVFEWLGTLQVKLEKMGNLHHLEVILSELTIRGIHPPQVGHPGNGPDPSETAASPPLKDHSPAP